MYTQRNSGRISATGSNRSFGLLLRGGGHGALAAGFIDELLAEGISFDAISAVGAGAANAAVLAYGLALGGRRAGQNALRAFWRHVRPAELHSQKDKSAPSEPIRIEAALRRLVDFDTLQTKAVTPLFLTAANARTGAPRLFAGREIGLDTVLAAMSPKASARAIYGEHYCLAGGSEEYAALPLVGEHEASRIVAPFFSPALRPPGREWSMGQASARVWLASQVSRPPRRAIETARLAA